MINDEPTCGMQLLTQDQVRMALQADPDRWIPIRGGLNGPSYGCGRCSTPLVVGISIHMLNRGVNMSDGVTAYGAGIRCGQCGAVNTTHDPVIRYLDPAQIFLFTLEDLMTRSRDGSTEYDSLMAAPLLRKLLLDGGSLVDQVNRSYREKIRFQVNHPRIWMSEASFSYEMLMLDDLDPETAEYQNVREMSKDQFLAHEVINFSGLAISVHDLIDYVCYIEGGVHVVQPSSDWQVALVERRDLLRIDGKPFWAASLPAIGRITFKALGPLRERVMSSQNRIQTSNE